MGGRAKGASMRRARVIIVGVAIVALATAASAAGARQRTSDTFTFSDPFSGSFDCGAFTATFSGHDKGRVTTWFDAADDPIVQIGRIQPPETVFETAAFDRSATPPRSLAARRQGIRWFLKPRCANASPPEPGLARRDAKRKSKKRNEEEGAIRGKHSFPRTSEPAAQPPR